MLPNGHNEHHRSKFDEFFNRWPPRTRMLPGGYISAPKRCRWSEMCLLGHSQITGLATA
jgi:hypothetical protein